MQQDPELRDHGKWNKIEHRLFSFMSINWRGRPLRSYETVVNPIVTPRRIPS